MVPPPLARVPWWVWPTILSLDAPAVAVVWQHQLAGDAGVSLGWPHRFVLAASVWLAYAGDRWIEGWRLPPAQVRTRRHAFYQRHRWSVLAVMGVVLAADVWCAAGYLAPQDLRAGAMVTAAVLMYLFSHQLMHRHHAWLVPKEVIIALLLGCGAALFPFVSPDANTVRLMAPFGLFSLLAFANCALISSWEQHVDRAHGQMSIALQFRDGPAVGRVAMYSVMAGAALVGIGGGSTHAVTAGCASASAFLLSVLDAAQPRIGPAAARVLSDVALLTPLAALGLGW